jgi:hypothetical protein
MFYTSLHLDSSVLINQYEAEINTTKNVDAKRIMDTFQNYKNITPEGGNLQL